MSLTQSADYKARGMEQRTMPQVAGASLSVATVTHGDSMVIAHRTALIMVLELPWC
jgi:hypothetical protein